MTRDDARDRWYLLDGLRGIAAVLVVVHHFNLVGYDLAQGAYVAVDFFFALSGLVLAAVYERQLAGGLSTARFMKGRAIRLYPLFVVGIALGAVREVSRMAIGDPAAWSIGDVARSTALGAALLPDPWGGGALYPLNTPAWSLLFELIANIAFALMLTRWRVSSLAVLASAALLYLTLQGWLLGTLVFGDHWSAFDIALARVVAMFTIGVICFRLGRGWRRRESWWALAPVVLFLAALTWHGDAAHRWSIDILLVAAGTPVLLLCGIRIDLPAALRPVAAWLGDVSYPVYVLHAPLLWFWHQAAMAVGWTTTTEVAGFVVVMLGLATALVPLDARLRASWSGRLHLRGAATPSSGVANS